MSERLSVIDSGPDRDPPPEDENIVSFGAAPLSEMRSVHRRFFASGDRMDGFVSEGTFCSMKGLFHKQKNYVLSNRVPFVEARLVTERGIFAGEDETNFAVRGLRL